MQDEAVELLRWPGGVRCPYCGGARVSSLAARRRRCLGCRRRFCWRTGTALHASKLSASQWATAAGLADTSAGAVAQELGVSARTARRVSELLRSAGENPTERLRCLLAMPKPRPRRTVPDTALSTLPSGCPLRVRDVVMGMTRGERLAMNALRHRCFGATTATVAHMSGLSVGHTRRCLKGLQRRGWATREPQSWAWGYGMVRVGVWRLSWSGDCALAMGCMPRLAVQQPAAPAGTVPAEFWHNFWSGTPADEMNISTHGLLIALTLASGRDPAASLWALNELPTDVLRQCRHYRGFQSGAAARRIDAATKARDD